MLNDFQRELYGTKSLINKTLHLTSKGDYLVVAGVEPDANSINQNEIVLYKLDGEYNIVWQQGFDIQLVGYGGAFKPHDIIETKDEGITICGELIIEGAENGGFTLHFEKEGNGYHQTWFKLYPAYDPNTGSQIRLVTDVVEVADGYMLLGTDGYSQSQKGILIKTDFTGNVMWSKRLYDLQNGAFAFSVVNDIVKISDYEVALVGTANIYGGFFIDDSDIMIVKIDIKGNTSARWIYERKDKVYGDGQPAFIETGDAIVYNEGEEALIVVGTQTQKVEGQCAYADEKTLLSLSVNIDDGSINWVNKNYISIALNYQYNFDVRDMVYNKKYDEYAICGVAYNDLFSKTTNQNSYIMRLDNNGTTTANRFYGRSSVDELSAITFGSQLGSYTAAGTITNKSKNIWIVESFEDIKEECHQKIDDFWTKEYAMQYHKGHEQWQEVIAVEKEGKSYGVKTVNDVICKKQKSGLTTVPYLTSLSKEVLVYPSPASEQLVINNTGKFASFLITSAQASTKVNTLGGELTSGLNEVNVSSLSPGIYIVNLTGDEYIEKIRISIE